MAETTSGSSSSEGKLGIVWIRRNMRLEDNRVLYEALQKCDQVFVIFIFDTEVLKRFENPEDHRLAFLADTLMQMNERLNFLKSEVIVFHGNPKEIIPKLVSVSEAVAVYCDEDFEPYALTRDEAVSKGLSGSAEFHSVLDHLVCHPKNVLKGDGTPYKVFTPFMKAYRNWLKPKVHFKDYGIDLKGRLYKFPDGSFKNSGLKRVAINLGPQKMLKEIGYTYSPLELWPVTDVESRMQAWVKKHVSKYEHTRNFPADEDGTSRLSPYIRFGLISPRACFRAAWEEKGNFIWVNELIWREFYGGILYHFPQLATMEFIEKYRNVIPWTKDDSDELLNRWKDGKTGFPIIDASMRQLREIGWMHNRARMIVASFLTKNLLIDWRKGEEHFAQHLMDYDLASNMGGWQWSASTGVDPQPYFRVFNPIAQSEKYDKEGVFIKRYLPELKSVPAYLLHDPEKMNAAGKRPKDYPKHMCNLSNTRKKYIDLMKTISSAKK